MIAYQNIESFLLSAIKLYLNFTFLVLSWTVYSEFSVDIKDNSLKKLKHVHISKYYIGKKTIDKNQEKNVCKRSDRRQKFAQRDKGTLESDL